MHIYILYIYTATENVHMSITVEFGTGTCKHESHDNSILFENYFLVERRAYEKYYVTTLDSRTKCIASSFALNKIINK